MKKFTTTVEKYQDRCPTCKKAIRGTSIQHVRSNMRMHRLTKHEVKNG